EAGSDLVADAADLDGAYTALCELGDGERYACEALWEHVHRAESVALDVQSADAAVQATSVEALDAAAEELGALQTEAAATAEATGEVASGVASAETTAAEIAGGIGELYDGA